MLASQVFTVFCSKVRVNKTSFLTRNIPHITSTRSFPPNAISEANLMTRKEKVVEDEPVKPDVKALEQYAREAENYISNCKKFEVDIDPSVVIALSTGWNVLKPSKSTREGSLLPLIGILEDNTHITKINLADVTMQDGR